MMFSKLVRRNWGRIGKIYDGLHFEIMGAKTA